MSGRPCVAAGNETGRDERQQHRHQLSHRSSSVLRNVAILEPRLLFARDLGRRQDITLAAYFLNLSYEKNKNLFNATKRVFDREQRGGDWIAPGSLMHSSLLSPASTRVIECWK